MNIGSGTPFEQLGGHLQARLNLIMESISQFWEQPLYPHFTNHGPTHSERVYRHKLGQLAQELPERLTQEEVFIVSAAAWLYEIGLQSPNLCPPIMSFTHQPGTTLTQSQLREIRAKKHLLTEQLIYASLSPNYRGPSLGLTGPLDDYIRLVATVCRGCSDESLDDVPEDDLADGLPVRVRLLVALLRLADQLYIESSRVNLDRLQNANLRPAELAYWWLFHYTTIPPLAKSQIRFYYFLPEIQKQWLGHIRGLIEPQFELRNNAALRFLWNRFDMHLVLNTNPQARFDQPGTFHREMIPEVLEFLRRNISPIGGSIIELPEEERCLLVLDYETLVLQLGEEGHFLAPDQLRSHLITLLRAANDAYGLQVRAIAVGSWQRAELTAAASALPALYQKLAVVTQEDARERLAVELQNRLQSAETYKRIIFVAPREDWTGLVDGLGAGRRSVSVWIPSVTEADIYRAVVRDCRPLAAILGLPTGRPLHIAELGLTEAACILQFEDLQKRNPAGVTYEEITNALARISYVQGHASWWTLKFLHSDLMAPTSGAGQRFVLNCEHPLFQETNARRRAVVDVLRRPDYSERGARQDDLLRALRSQAHFRSYEDDDIVAFLEILKDDELLSRRIASDQGGLASWRLRQSALPEPVGDPARFLLPVVLTVDHFVVGTGHDSLHGHNAARELRPNVGANQAETAYGIAQKEGWLECRDTGQKQERRPDQPLIKVTLNLDHEDVCHTLRNRNILLNILRKRSATEGLEREALWQQLHNTPAFTLDPSEYDDWLQLLERDHIITVRPSTDETPHDRICLNLDSLLTRRLLGRMQFYGLITTLRLSRATNPGNQQPVGNILTRLADHVTKDPALATWTLEYARQVRLVEIAQVSTPQGTTEHVFLNTRHGFVRHLDQREVDVCGKVVELTRSLASRPNREALRHVVVAAMDKDLCFGYDRTEHEYWVDQTIYHKHWMAERWDGRGPGSRCWLRITQSDVSLPLAPGSPPRSEGQAPTIASSGPVPPSSRPGGIPASVPPGQRPGAPTKTGHPSVTPPGNKLASRMQRDT